MSNIKALTIQVSPNAEPTGQRFEWDTLPQIEVFSNAIVIPPLNKDANGVPQIDIGHIVSGMPTIFARANMFKIAFDNYNVDASRQDVSELLYYYKYLLSEWKGLFACVALNYQDLTVERVYLKYSDGNSLMDTANIYEAAGAFGNMLLEDKYLWTEPNSTSSDTTEPFIDILLYKDQVVGAVCAKSFLFTSVSYKVTDALPFVNQRTGRFVDPLNGELSFEQVSSLYAYTKHVLNNANSFCDLYPTLKVQIGSVLGGIQSWLADIEQYGLKRSWTINNPKTLNIPEIGDKFKFPFGMLFDYSTTLYGEEGILESEKGGDDRRIAFDPKDLLLPENTELVEIDFGKEGFEKNIAPEKPLMLLPAKYEGQVNMFAYFALPLTPIALKVFGKNLAAVLGLNDGANIKSRLTARFNADTKTVIVTLRLFTQADKEVVKEVVYKVSSESLVNQDVLVWPNFISKQWGKYYLYSEIPHNDIKTQCVPFLGNSLDENFKIIEHKNGEPFVLAHSGNIQKVEGISEDTVERNSIKFDLMVAYSNLVADNKYKYEIYESNRPFKGLKFSKNGHVVGYAIIRYSQNNAHLPKDMLNDNILAKEVSLGIDFGSTNTSIAFYPDSNGEIGTFKLSSNRFSLIQGDNKDNNKNPAVENEILFFQKDSINSNAIKSVLATHDQKRIVSPKMPNEFQGVVKGGVPCFGRNLPISTADNQVYKLQFKKLGTTDLIHNMKWLDSEIDKSNKIAYLSSLVLHVYANLFLEGYIVKSIKWAYPSSMPITLVQAYLGVWNELSFINPWTHQNRVKIAPLKLPETPDGSSTRDFNFEELDGRVALTEAAAVANYIKNNNIIGADQGITLCFDIGGSTTDITALTMMKSPDKDKGEALAMIKQNSIRFAAQRVSQATRYARNFQKCLRNVCEKEGLNIDGLTSDANKFSPETAPYYFEQVVDRLQSDGLELFYDAIRTDCPELFSVNLYVTGLIMYYAGQLSRKLRSEILNSEERINGINEDWKPSISVIFAGKGGMIFDWFYSIDEEAATKYYTELFILGFGGKESVDNNLNYNKETRAGIRINPTMANGAENRKYEVSKGLAVADGTGNILVPQNREVLEIIGEEGFVSIDSDGVEIKLPFDTTITPEMLSNIGTSKFKYLFNPDINSPKFAEFADFFYSYATTFFGLKATKNDFKSAFDNMNINTYVSNLPEFKKAKMIDGKFDFVAPIIILEGMKFYEETLLKLIQR